MLMKVTPVAYFSNISLAALLPIFFHQKITKQTVNGEKLHKTLSYKKSAFEVLVKLTPVANFSNILGAAFTGADPQK